MTTRITFFATALLLGMAIQAQKIKEKDLIGTWKLIIDVEEEIEKEVEEADTMLEEIFMKTVSGLVEGIMEDIDIYFEFKKNNKLAITVNAYDETETEYGSWYINKKGNMIMEDIGSDNEDFNISNDDDEWKLIDGILVSEEHEENRNVYMARVE